MFGVARHNFVQPAPYRVSGSSAFWSTTSLAANLILSNNNLTVTAGATSGSNNEGRGDTLIGTSVNRYWEVTFDTDAGGATAGIGVCNATETFPANQFLGQTANGVGYFNDTNVYRSGASIKTLTAFVAGNVICIASVGGGKTWWRINNGNWNNAAIGTENPATNTGGVDTSVLGTSFYPAYTVVNNSGTKDKWTANFGPNFAFTPPAGFSGFP